MNRPVLAIVAIGAGVVGGAILTYSLTRPGREAPATTVTPGAPAPLPPPREAPRAVAPPPRPRPPRLRRRPPVAPRPRRPNRRLAPAEAPLSVGVLHIDSDVPGAQVFIDREFLGVAPVTAAERQAGHAPHQRLGRGLRRDRRNDRGVARAARPHDQVERSASGREARRRPQASVWARARAA